MITKAQTLRLYNSIKLILQIELKLVDMFSFSHGFIFVSHQNKLLLPATSA